MASQPGFVPCAPLGGAFLRRSALALPRTPARVGALPATRCVIPNSAHSIVTAAAASAATPAARAPASSSPQIAALVTEAEVLAAQDAWGSGVVRLGALADDRAALEAAASMFLEDLYAFNAIDADNGYTVLFKPTRAAVRPFRPGREEALSYFIAGDDRVCPEDAGFAISPPWTAVRFDNIGGIVLENGRALAMGHYYFTDASDSETKVEYTFGYKLVDGQLKIDLHHSSLPFSPPQ